MATGMHSSYGVRISPQHIGSSHSVPRATRAVADKPSFQPAFQEAAAATVQPKPASPAADVALTPFEPPPDEAPTKNDKRTETQAAKPGTPVIPVNKKTVSSTCADTDTETDTNTQAPTALWTLNITAPPWAIAETPSPPVEIVPANPVVPKLVEALPASASQGPNQTASPGPPVFQLSFQVPEAEEAAPAPAPEPPPEDIPVIKLAPQADPLIVPELSQPVQSRAAEQPVRPPPRPPEEPPAPASTGPSVQKMGVLVRGDGDQVVRLEISQSNGSVRVAAHSPDELLAQHLRASVPDLVDRLDRQGYTPAVTSSEGPSQQPNQPQPRQQRERRRNAWQALASQLHDN